MAHTSLSYDFCFSVALTLFTKMKKKKKTGKMLIVGDENSNEEIAPCKDIKGK